MNEALQEYRSQDYQAVGFAIGLAAGAAVGAGLALWFVPRLATDLRRRLTDSAAQLGGPASEQDERASTRVGESVGELARQGQGLGENAATAVAGGTREVERVAAATKFAKEQ